MPLPIFGETTGLRIEVQRKISTLLVEVVIYEHIRPGRIALYNPFISEVTEIELGEEVPGNYKMKLPDALWRQLLGALKREADKAGIVGEPESVLKGKLGATERHLEDLRHLLKLPKLLNG